LLGILAPAALEIIVVAAHENGYQFAGRFSSTKQQSDQPVRSK
jgi:hypothetical protein